MARYAFEGPTWNHKIIDNWRGNDVNLILDAYGFVVVVINHLIHATTVYTPAGYVTRPCRVYYASPDPSIDLVITGNHETATALTHFCPIIRVDYVFMLLDSGRQSTSYRRPTLCSTHCTISFQHHHQHRRGFIGRLWKLHQTRLKSFCVRATY